MVSPQFLEWETHASLVLAVFAFGVGIVTLPTAFQMFWGKPNIVIKPNLHVGDNGARILRCYIGNAPMNKRFLRALGVVRADAEVGCDFSITEIGTNKKIAESIRPILYGEADEARHLRISAGMVPARIVLAYHNDLEAKIWDGDEIDKITENGTGISIASGYYRAIINLHISNYGFNTHEFDFNIGDTPSRTYWRGWN